MSRLAELCASKRFPFSTSGKLRYKLVDCGYTTPCWVWQMALLHGYPYETKLGGRAHRWFYKQLVDPDLSSTMQLHHKCEVKSCVNPWHCEPQPGGTHQRMHNLGRKMKISDKERARRRAHGKRMMRDHMKGTEYTKSDRSETMRRVWRERRGD